MNDQELSPIKRGQVNGFVMMRADLDTMPAVWEPKVAKINPAQLHKPFNDAARAIAGMATIMEIAGANSEQAMKAAATFQLIGAGVEISAGFQSIIELLTAAKTAEGVAQLSKYTVAAPLVAAAAIAGVVAFVVIMESKEFNFTGDYSGASGQRKLQNEITREGLKNG